MELKAAHGELADLFADLLNETQAAAVSPRVPSISYSVCIAEKSEEEIQVFPQALKRDNGSVNLRKVRNLWFHLLHTGSLL